MDTEKAAEQGRQIYNTKLKEKLEKEARGRIVAIDVKTEKHYIADTVREAMDAARNANPDAFVYVIRIGSKAVYTIGFLL